eukprot:2741666-Prymnesium_polylepis.1
MHYQRLASDVDLSEEAELRRIEAGQQPFADKPDAAAPGGGADAPAAEDIELPWLSEDEDDFAEGLSDVQTCTSKPDAPACETKPKPTAEDHRSNAAPAPAVAPREEERRRPVAPAPKAPRIVPASQASSAGAPRIVPASQASFTGAAREGGGDGG